MLYAIDTIASSGCTQLVFRHRHSPDFDRKCRSLLRLTCCQLTKNKHFPLLRLYIYMYIYIYIYNLIYIYDLIYIYITMGNIAAPSPSIKLLRTVKIRSATCSMFIKHACHSPGSYVDMQLSSAMTMAQKMST